MNPFDPKNLFELTNFQHAEIFNNIQFVWEALSQIKTYLSKTKLGKIEVDIPSGVTLVNPELINIGKNTKLEPGCYIAGPCIIGEGCTIRHGAYIRGDFICGDRCVVGHTTEVKGSIFLNDVQAAHFAYVGDSILGNKVNLGAGTKCANLRFDRKLVEIVYERIRHQTHLKKFGAVFGDLSQSGCNSVTNPGTVFLKEAYCNPCSSVMGVIKPARRKC